MKWTLIIIVIAFLKSVNMQEFQGKNEKKQNFGVSNFVEENDTDVHDVAIGVSSITKLQLSKETLSDLFTVAKNISHSKGIYQKTDKKEIPTDEYEIRRSIKRKAIISSSSDVVENILNQILSDEDTTLSLLDHMEFLVHEFDVAVSFANLGGIQIISPLLFSSDDEIVCSAALVLGAAMQSNPTVQKIALQQSLGSNLLKLLSHKSPTVLSRVIFALASFLRNAPEAQEEFIVAKGVPKLIEILKNQQVTTNIKLKIITLFGDLVHEHGASQDIANDPSSQQTQKVKKLLASELQNQGICPLIHPFLEFEDVDTHEKVVLAMTSMCHICSPDFQKDTIIKRVKYLMNIYNPDTDDALSLNSAVDLEIKRMLYESLTLLLNEIKQNSKEPVFMKYEL